MNEWRKCDEILFSNEKEGNLTICSEMDEA